MLRNANTLFLLIFLSVSSGMFAQVGKRIVKIDPAKVPLKEVGKLPKILREASGLEMSAGGYFWSHNDDGIPAVYCLDSAANLLRAVQLNASNRGWEDLTIDSEGNLYIGSFGNNKNDRKDLRILKIRNPEEIDEPVCIPEIIQYTYSDQKSFPPGLTGRHFDVDAFFAWENALYLFTKNRSKPFRGVSRIYKLSGDPGTHTALLIDSLFVGEGAMINNWITGADISPDGTVLALLFHDRIWFLKDFTKENFSSAKIFELPLNHYSHKAGIAFAGNSRVYIVDELEFDMLGGKMYYVDLSGLWKPNNPN